MAYRGALPRANDDSQSLSVLRNEGREPGARRKKIAGYLRAANELRQSYASSWNAPNSDVETGDDMPGSFPDAAVVRGGDEEMILFPSYAMKHIKQKPQAQTGTIQEESGTGRDARDTVGAGDAEFWKQQWETYEQDKAVVDVDVRGWLYAPNKGQLSRKHRLMVGLARQLVGIPAPSSMTSPTSSRPGSRSSSPTRVSTKEEELISFQAEEIMKNGEAKADIAGKGGFSEQPSNDSDGDSLYDPADKRSSSRATKSRHGSSAFDLATTRSHDSVHDSEADVITALQKRSSWTAPASMTAAEITTANNYLMTRLKPFMANPVVNTAISAFFYNDKVSRQRTIHTNAAGHFHLRAALDFVPTHVRVLASEKISATEEINVTPAYGVTLISDIDDTVKHTAVTSGAREIFRNAFIRDLGDLTIEGVKQWYNKLADMGVQVHYVSNSPWQLYPVLTSFFKLAGLPKGSFHLKQYSGMLQGIFEPVAERKKATLDRILRDFPDRKYILVGDSGEADLEVYTDVVCEHPGRVLGIFIRDVTTPASKGGFFDSSMGPSNGDRRPRNHSRHRSGESLAQTKRFSRPDDTIDDDADLRMAIANSMKDMEAQASKDRRAVFSDQPERTRFPGIGPEEAGPRLPPRRSNGPPASQTSAVEENLIDFSDDDEVIMPPPPRTKPSAAATKMPLRLQTTTANGRNLTSPPPPPPPAKPQKFRTSSITSPSEASDTVGAKPPPPKPRKPSTSVAANNPSPLSQVQQSSPLTSRPPPLPKRQSYSASAKSKISAAYNSLPSASNYFSSSQAPSSRPGATPSLEDSNIAASPASISSSKKPTEDLQALRQPRPPARRNLSSYPAAAAQFASTHIGGAWYGGNNETGNTDASGQAINKKEELWNRRWARAKAIMDKEGVILRTWKVGADVMDVCVDAVEKALKEVKQDDGDEKRGR